ncbi:MAG: tRNA pseudouridine(38-40) synthase TruA [Balneolaceae bacterium]
MPRYKLTIEFDGTNFSGWQIQPDSRTVEEEIEKAFSKILQKPIDIIGQGRTDAGVHAKGQVAHVDLPDSINPQKLIFGVNGLIGKEIEIYTIDQVHDDFHARFDAFSREYEYSITKKSSPLKRGTTWYPKYELNFERMNQCVALLSGEFDFKGFSKYNADNYTTLCTIQLCELIENEEDLKLRIRANRFLRNMVRRLVGSMVEVGKGTMTVSEFKENLENPSSELKTFTAPAKGLVLTKVFYEKN